MNLNSDVFVCFLFFVVFLMIIFSLVKEKERYVLTPYTTIIFAILAFLFAFFAGMNATEGRIDLNLNHADKNTVYHVLSTTLTKEVPKQEHLIITRDLKGRVIIFSSPIGVEGVS